MLLVEAVREGGPIRRQSLNSLQGIYDQLKADAAFNVSLREVASAAELRAAVKECEPSILLLSAHGHITPGNWLATIVIGNDKCIGPELGPMPPIVILSACHTAPRGATTVNVAELLLTQGARAVLASSVALHVEHNALLMARFIGNMIAARAGTVEARTLADVWHYTAQSNVVLDIAFANPQILDWTFDRAGRSTSPLEDYVLGLPSNGTQLGHVYEGTERAFREIMVNRGVSVHIRRVVEQKLYLPETLFYFFIGWPEQISFADAGLDKLMALHEQSPLKDLVERERGPGA